MNECKCRRLTIFDLSSSFIHKGRERCRKCGELINENVVEWVWSNPIKGIYRSSIERSKK